MLSETGSKQTYSCQVEYVSGVGVMPADHSILVRDSNVICEIRDELFMNSMRNSNIVSFHMASDSGTKASELGIFYSANL